MKSSPMLAREQNYYAENNCREHTQCTSTIKAGIEETTSNTTKADVRVSRNL